jgi:CRISPR type III-A-associated RAMP protein Csm4
MRLGFLVRLRPTGPWRIGPDSGARDRVETIYHSDSMYSAVTAAMARVGRLEEWLAATAANPDGSEVRFSSCYPFQRKTMFVVPPRSVWPPPASAKIRYKGARFVPLQLVASLLADQPVDETRWLLDGASECLLPSDRNEGPFRATLRSSAVVDRLTPGACDVHTTACLEFATGCGLWFLVGFASREARERWAGPVKTALRLLADTGFGGERSQGWGRSEMPEFVDGDLTGFVLPPRRPKPPRAATAAVIATPPVAELAVEPLPAIDAPLPAADALPAADPLPSRDGDGAVPGETAEPPASEPVPEPLADARGSEPNQDAGEAEVTETPAEEPAPPEKTEDGAPSPVTEQPVAEEPAPPDEAAPVGEAPIAEVPAKESEEEAPPPVTEEPTAEETAAESTQEPAAEEPVTAAPAAEVPEVETPVAEERAEEESDEGYLAAESAEEPAADEAIPAQQAWWMLSLFTPNAADQVDWSRGKYALVVRSGRVESEARHGDLKTPANMIQEGSVLISDTEPRGGARNVAPESFPHPVYRAGFAVAIPIPLRVTP